MNGVLLAGAPLQASTARAQNFAALAFDLLTRISQGPGNARKSASAAGHYELGVAVPD